MAHIGTILLDQLLGQFIQAIKVITGMGGADRLEAQPLDNISDRFEIFLLLTGGIGIVVAQIADSTVVLGETEIDSDGLAVADVQISVGLGRESSDDVLLRTFLVDISQEADFEHLLGIDWGSGLLFGPGSGWGLGGLGRLWFLFFLLFLLFLVFLLLGFGGGGRGSGGSRGRRPFGERLWLLGLWPC